MILKSGKVPEKDIKMVYTGLRCGEKLYEELFHADEKLDKTTHAKIFLADHHNNNWAHLKDTLEQLAQVCDSYVEKDIKNVLKRIVPELNDKGNS